MGAVDLYFSNLAQKDKQSVVHSEIEYVVLDIIQISMTLTAIYLLVIYAGL